MAMTTRVLACLLLLVLAGPVSGAPAQEPPDGPRITVRDLKVEGVDQRLLLVAPPAPRAVLVMLPGGSGRIGIQDDGAVRNGENFLVRTRARFAALGFALVIADAADGTNLRGRRSTPAYGRIVAAIVRFAHEETGRPVFLVGTSQGAIAAMNGAARLAQGPGAEGLAGLVLTESVSRVGGSRETVFDADPAAVTAPVLVIANGDDACPVAPPADAARIAASLTASHGVEVVRVSGGVTAGRACGSHSPHGFWQMEDEVMGIMVRWIDAQLGRKDP